MPEDLPPGADIHDLLGPFLRWVASRAGLGTILWPTEPRREAAWGAELKHLETSGEYETAIERVQELWPSAKSWSLAVQVLHFSDLLGTPDLGLERYARLGSELGGPPPDPETGHAAEFYRGRLLGQAGNIRQALDQHSRNVAAAGTSDRFQVLSRFEVAQLLFRVEDFKASRREFQVLWDIVQTVQGEDRLACDILKFMATLEVVDRIYDLPFSSSLSLAWRKGTADKCIEYADRAYRHAELAGYEDGLAWALCVKAFGLEARVEWDEAESTYDAALNLCRTGRCRRSSLAHISTYKAGFYRRRGDLDVAEGELERARVVIPSEQRLKDHARVLEELALVLYLKGEADRGHGVLTAALRLY
ncbi:MAG: hypothetical protein ACREKH_01565, partial [Candidatus Rokuibacteriota bacterium]